MPERVTLNLPSDVVATLRASGDMDAFVTEVVRWPTGRDRHDGAMRALGIDPEVLRTPEAKERVRRLLYISEEQKASRREFARKLVAGEIEL